MSAGKIELGLLLPTAGSDALRRLLSAFERKSLTRINHLLGKSYGNYSPWMSMEGIEGKVEPLFDAFQANGTLVKDSRYLETLANAVESDGRIGVNYFFKSSAPDMRIARSVPQEIAEYFEEAKTTIFQSWPEFESLFRLLVRQIVPLIVRQSIDSPIAGFSSMLCPGVIFLSSPPVHRATWKVELGVDLAHEFAHNLISLYQRSDRLILSDVQDSVYSGILETDRPSIMALHGSAALAYICLASISLLERAALTGDESHYLMEELGRSAPKLADTVESLSSTCSFSEVGGTLVQELATVAQVSNKYLEFKRG